MIIGLCVITWFRLPVPPRIAIRIHSVSLWANIQFLLLRGEYAVQVQEDYKPVPDLGNPLDEVLLRGSDNVIQKRDAKNVRAPS